MKKSTIEDIEGIENIENIPTDKLEEFLDRLNKKIEKGERDESSEERYRRKICEAKEAIKDTMVLLNEDYELIKYNYIYYGTFGQYMGKAWI